MTSANRNTFASSFLAGGLPYNVKWKWSEHMHYLHSIMQLHGPLDSQEYVR